MQWHADQPPVGAIEDELHHAVLIADDLTARVVAVERAPRPRRCPVVARPPPDARRSSPRGSCRCRRAARPETSLLVVEAERVADRHARLLHRGRGERGEADDVARGEDAAAPSCGTLVDDTWPRGSTSMPSASRPRPRGVARDPRRPGRCRRRASGRSLSAQHEIVARDASPRSTPSLEMEVEPRLPHRGREALAHLAVEEGQEDRARSISVTSTPSAANMQAYSQPITPPPMTASSSGQPSIARIPSASWTWPSSNGISGAVRRRAGGDEDTPRR